MPPAAKNTRWNLRVAAFTDETVRQAASVSQRNLTEFVQQAALSQAERVLGDRTSFVVEPAEWQELSALLDRPPQDNPGLATLFAKPDVFTS